MPKLKATISYDGTKYSGWQVQPNALTIQEVLQKTLATILSHKVSVIASGRTDSGVHARGQVAHFIVPSDTCLTRLHRSLNGLLPDDIRILLLEPVPDTFHARFSAQKKIYHYYLCLNDTSSPFLKKYQYHVRSPFDLERFKLAANHFVGTHDFTSFANQADRGSAKNAPVKTLYRLDVTDTPEGVQVEFEGNGFLYKMVRNIMGALLTAAADKLDPDLIPHILEQKDRTQAPKAAAAKGLFLEKVFY